MPNHVTNYIKLVGDANRIAELKERIKNDKYGLGTIDFNKIIPMPESLHIGSSTRTIKAMEAYRSFVNQYGKILGMATGNLILDASDLPIPLEAESAYLETQSEFVRENWELGKTAFKNVKLYGYPTWYEWANDNWNTKWNAYGYEEGGNYNGLDDELWFQTAWAAPHPILLKLTKDYPDIRFIHEWADEDIGFNCGRREYFNGKLVDWYYPEGEEAERFAESVWGKYDF